MMDDAVEQTRFRRGTTGTDLDRSNELIENLQTTATTARKSRLSLLTEEEEKSSD